MVSLVGLVGLGRACACQAHSRFLADCLGFWNLAQDSRAQSKTLGIQQSSLGSVVSAWESQLCLWFLVLGFGFWVLCLGLSFLPGWGLGFPLASRRQQMGSIRTMDRKLPTRGPKTAHRWAVFGPCGPKTAHGWAVFGPWTENCPLVVRKLPI